MLSPERNAEPATKTSTSRSPSQIVKAAGMIFGNLENVSFDPEIDCPPHACYNCWSSNHLIKDCDDEKSRLYCCNCGRMDVRVTECARCSKAFFQLDVGFRKWVYRNFLNSEPEEDEDNKWRKNVDLNWDEDEFQSFYSCGYDSTKNEKDIVEDDDVKVNWESHSDYAQPNDLFTYMRAEKIRDEFESDKINNGDAVNLDDTRMADRDSFGENSIVSIEEVSPTADEPLPGFLKLMNAVKHLSVDTQEVVVLQFMSERKKLSEMQNDDKSKLP